MHGLASSAWVWINNTDESSLAFHLADKGYDVWIGN
jgi:lysosomal acid lipase/cholesteryl ester hydrolase